MLLLHRPDRAVAWFALLSVIVLANERACGADSESEPNSLPEAVASFGAVTHEGWIYVYSGHVGTAHAHSKENLSRGFYRRRAEGGAWEKLPLDEPLQGLALVAHEGFLYRVGGMSATNRPDEPAVLTSTSTFARFDPIDRTWTHLQPLPSGRSSHDAVVIDSKLFVVGGWKLTGGDEGEWHNEMLVFDLSEPDAGWRAVAQPFQRRALAASQHDGKLFAIGGMNTQEEVDRSVDVFDPVTSEWSTGPEFPGEGMNGFGVSAWNSGERLIASGSDGVVYRLSDDLTRWEEIQRLSTPRFFHRLVAGTDGEMLALGGASRKGHLDEIEAIRAGK
jgi:hypothetical protein